MRFSVWPWRRVVQVIVLASLIVVPLGARYGHYVHTRQSAKVLTAWQGTAPGAALAFVDASIRAGLKDVERGVRGRMPRAAVLGRLDRASGSVWSMRFFGCSLTDLLAGLECSVVSRSFSVALLAGVLLPLLATLLLGRVYCGWICPMRLLFDLGLRARQLLAFLELHTPRVTFWKGNKYIVLAVGLSVGAAVGLPLLQGIYPPALLAREGHAWVMSVYDRAEAGQMGLALAGLSGASLFLLVVMLIEVAVAPGFWCQSLCPGGAVYSMLGRWRLWRLRRDIPACTSCTLCDKACPMGLLPMVDRTGNECDSCGICVDVCPTKALAFHISPSSGGFGGPPRLAPVEAVASVSPGNGGPGPVTTVAAAVVLGLCVVGPAQGHHILGIPHYAYDESYPQAPVLKLVENLGPLEIQLTSYPGRPTPGVRTEMHIYVRNLTTLKVYREPLRVTVNRVHPFSGRELTYGPVEATPLMNLYRFFPTYPAQGHYEVLVEQTDDRGVNSLRFALVIGDPGNPLLALTLFIGGLVTLLVVVRAIRIKRARRRARFSSDAEPTSPVSLTTVAEGAGVR